MFRTATTHGTARDAVFRTRPRRGSSNRSRSRSIGFVLLLIVTLLGVLASAPAHGETFTRSDANADGATDLSDALTILLFLFNGTPAELQCDDAADVDDSGTIDLTDATFLLDYLFVGGASPSEPLGACGVDPTEDDLGCDSFPTCAVTGDGGITEVPGDPAGDAAELVPVIEYEPDLAHFSTEGVPGLGASTRDAVVMLRTGVTVGELNGLLAQEGASIVGSMPKVEVVENALVVLRFPTSTPLELLDLTDRLESDQVVDVAIPDILLGPDVVTDDTNAVVGITGQRGCDPHGIVGASGSWKWELPDGGNWGLESARVPQMWNWNTSMPVFSNPVVTGVVDGGVAGHADVDIRSAPNNPAKSRDPDHGLHVAGIIGAKHDGQGIDGVNPFVDLVGTEFDTAWSTVGNILDLLLANPDTAVVNMSYGLGWIPRPLTRDLTAVEEELATRFARKHGTVFAVLAAAYGSTLFVSAAGNDHDRISANIHSPQNYAGLTLGAGNVLVVGSHDRSLFASVFSNTGEDILAPGEQILSATTGGYAVYCGTSMATALVSGVAGYLRAIDSSLSGHELKDLILAGGSTVNAYESVLGIDALRDNDEVLKMFLDIDDGTPDGNERVFVPAAELRRDRSFAFVVGPTDAVDHRQDDDLATAVTEGTSNQDGDADGNGGMGDGVIDASDFRRLRDWLYLSDPSGSYWLNGGSTHVKNDANLDGRVDVNSEGRVAATETTLYPRGDFNGDGEMSETGRAPPAARFTDYFRDDPTDFDFFVVTSNLSAAFAETGMGVNFWADELYTDPLELYDLYFSVDITVSAENYFYKYSEVNEIQIAPYDTATDEPIPSWSSRRITLTEDDPVQILSVPVRAEYYIAADPIELADGTKVLLRSIGEIELGFQDIGADLAVDLVRIEMTALATTSNPDEEVLESEPAEEEVDAFVGEPGDNTYGSAVASDLVSYGSRGWANEDGSFYCVARAGRLPDVDNSEEGTTFESSVYWQRSFLKREGEPDPSFQVNPMQLRIASAFAPFDYTAFAEIVVEMRAYAVSPVWQPVFFYRAEIAGRQLSAGHTFHLEFEEGDLPPGDFHFIYVTHPDGTQEVVGAEYVQQQHNGTIPLDGLEVGDSFEVRYWLNARVFSRAIDTIAEAYIGDPLDYGSGVRMRYGDFGELPRIDGVGPGAGGGAAVSFVAPEGLYSILYRDGIAVAVALSSGENELVDPGAPADATADEFTLEHQPVDQPLDLDGDGIDDVYELAHAEFLDPLNSEDARLDFDGDGRSNILEYEESTDPTVPDAPAESGADRFPALVFDPGVQNAGIADINSDGLADLIQVGGSFSPTITVALALEGGGFDIPLMSDLPSTGFSDDHAFADLNGDGFPDVVIAERGSDRVQVMIGDGLGGFTAGATFATGGDPRRVVAADVNGDGVADILTSNWDGASVSVLPGHGDGTLAAAIDTAMNFEARPVALAAADMDGDGRQDLVVALIGAMAVFPGNGDGTFGDQVESPGGGIDVSRLLTGDVNDDGNPDVLTSQGSSHIVQVSLGRGDGTLEPPSDHEVGRNPNDICLADLDDDGDLDLVVGHNSDAYHAILLNDGDGAFTPHTPAYTTASGNCLLADFTGDGRLDLLSEAQGNGYFVSEGLPGARFDTRIDVGVPDMYAPDFELADIDGDGWTDIVAANQAAATVEVFTGSVEGDFAHRTSVEIGPDPVQVAVLHLDAGDSPDIAVLAQRPVFRPGDATDRLELLFGDGSGGFTTGESIQAPEQPRELFAGDLDGDGDDDLALMFSYSPVSLAPYLNQGDGRFEAAPVVEIAGSPLYPVLRDLDGDGRADFVAPTADAGILIYLADATGQLVAVDDAFAAGPVKLDTFAGSVVRDLTGDGVLDLAGSITELGQTRIVYFPGNGDGSFGGEVILLEDAGIVLIEIADIDGDGLDDISSTYDFRLAMPDGTFGEIQRHWGRADLTRDLNGDGRPDRIGLAADKGALEILLQR